MEIHQYVVWFLALWAGVELFFWLFNNYASYKLAKVSALRPTEKPKTPIKNAVLIVLWAVFSILIIKSLYS